MRISSREKYYMKDRRFKQRVKCHQFLLLRCILQNDQRSHRDRCKEWKSFERPNTPLLQTICFHKGNLNTFYYTQTALMG